MLPLSEGSGRHRLLTASIPAWISRFCPSIVLGSSERGSRESFAGSLDWLFFGHRNCRSYRPCIGANNTGEVRLPLWSWGQSVPGFATWRRYAVSDIDPAFGARPNMDRGALRERKTNLCRGVDRPPVEQVSADKQGPVAFPGGLAGRDFEDSAAILVEVQGCASMLDLNLSWGIPVLFAKRPKSIGKMIRVPVFGRLADNFGAGRANGCRRRDDDSAGRERSRTTAMKNRRRRPPFPGARCRPGRARFISTPATCAARTAISERMSTPTRSGEA